MKLRILKTSLLLPVLAASLLASTAFAQTTPPPNEGLKIGPSSGAYEMSWWGVAGRTYFIQQTDDLLLPWQYLPLIESGADAPLAWGFTSTATATFLRLRYSDIPTSDPFAADFDGDKVGNFAELTNGTDPLGYTDQDQDGLPDDWERHYFGNLSHSGTADSDGDGLTDAAEFAQGTNPNSNDTDADGMPDGWEVMYGLKPTVDDARQDFDFDMHHNLTEFIYGTNPADHYNGTRPNINPPQPTTAKASVADGQFRVEWNDNSISETAFAIYKRTLDGNGAVTYQLLGKETPAATLFEKDIAPNEVLEGDHIVVIAEPSNIPPAIYVAAVVNQPLMWRCNETTQTFEVVQVFEDGSIAERAIDPNKPPKYAPAPTMSVSRAPTKQNMQATNVTINSDMVSTYNSGIAGNGGYYLESKTIKKYSTVALNRVEGQDWVAFAEPAQNAYSASHNFQIGKVNTLAVYTGIDYQSAGGLTAFLDEKYASVSGEISVHYYSDPYDPNPIIPSISAPHYLGTTHVGQWYHRDFDITQIPTTVNLLEWPILLGTWQATERNVVRDASFVFAGTHDLEGDWNWNGYELPADTYATETLSYTVQDSYSYQPSSIPNRRRVIIPRAWGTVSGPAEKRFDPLADAYPTYFAIPEPNSYDTFNIHLHGNPGKASDHNTQWTVTTTGGVTFADEGVTKTFNELNGEEVAFRANYHGEIEFYFGDVFAGKIIIKAYPRRNISVLHVGIAHVDPNTQAVSKGSIGWHGTESIQRMWDHQNENETDEVWLQGGPNVKITHHHHHDFVKITYKTRNNKNHEPSYQPYFTDTNATELTNDLNAGIGTLRGAHDIVCFWVHHGGNERVAGIAQPTMKSVILLKPDRYTFSHELGHAFELFHPWGWINSKKKPADSGKMIMGYYTGTGFPASQIDVARKYIDEKLDQP
jgi:hypothetical protein